MYGIGGNRVRTVDLYITYGGYCTVLPIPCRAKRYVCYGSTGKERVFSNVLVAHVQTGTQNCTAIVLEKRLEVGAPIRSQYVVNYFRKYNAFNLHRALGGQWEGYFCK